MNYAISWTEGGICFIFSLLFPRRLVMIMRLIKGIYVKIVEGLTFFIICLLLFYSLLSTTFMMIPEQTALSRENVLFPMATIIFSIIAAIMLPRVNIVKRAVCQINENDDLYKKIRKILLLVLFTITIMFVLSSQFIPRSDQIDVQNVVFKMHLGDFSDFDKNGYVGRCSNQRGLVLICYVFSLVFGSQNFVVFNIINALAICLLYIELAAFLGHIGVSRACRIGIYITGIMYAPIILYSYFAYGTLIGLSLSLLAIDFEFRYLRNHKVKYAILAALFIAVAVMVKSNYMIFMIGMLLFAFISAEKNWKSILILWLAIILCCFGQSYGTKKILSAITGKEMTDGMPAISFVTMGLQESDMGAGWYNGYHAILYNESGYDTQLQKTWAKADLKERLAFFRENHSEAIDFFTRKLASEWNDPTFSAFWLFNDYSTYSNIHPGAFVWLLQTDYAGFWGNRYCKIFQVIFIFGSLLYFIIGKKDENYEKSLILPTVFIGGFIFHFFWEAKNQYTLSYMVLLIPIAIMGYARLYKAFSKKRGSETVNKKKNLVQTLFIGSAMILTVLILMKLYIGRTDSLYEGTDIYQDYLIARLQPPVRNGEYIISTINGDYDLLNGSTIKLLNYHGRTRIYLENDEAYLQYCTDGDNNDVYESSFRDVQNQTWIIRETDGGYYIFADEDERIMLSYDKDNKNIIVKRADEKLEQVWNLQPK